MTILQRNRISPYNIKLYKSLGSLIKDFRQWHRLSQETLAESIGISVRELQNWEAGRCSARIENLHDLSEVTGIPMQVCVALNAGQPLLYSLGERRLAYSSAETIDFSFDELFKNRKKTDDNVIIKTAKISTDKHIQSILSSHRDIYGTNKSLGKDVLKAAIMTIPDLNLIAFDFWGHYVGHHVILPLKMDVYQELKTQKILENYLAVEKISHIVSLNEGVFFLYSLFAANWNVTHLLLINPAQYYTVIKQKERFLVAAWAATNEVKRYCEKLGMKIVSNCAGAKNQAHPEIVTSLYEIGLDALLKQYENLEIIGSKEHGRSATTKEPANRPKYEGQPCKTPIDNKNFIKRDVYKTQPVAEVLTVAGNCEVLSVVSSQASLILSNKDHKKKERTSDPGKNAVTCPNLKCSQSSKYGKSRIIFNGTYRSKDGASFPRFLCKNCGKSFCSKANTIFYGLRSPEGRILEAFKLLVRGMPLRRVASVLGIELRTVRHWLNFAVKRSDKIDVALMKALDVSQPELDELWASVKKGTLRQRATLWRKSNASNGVDPPS